ncbi:hypothetical protein [Novipirellula artificiosorum]|uniref:Uncharacterized protein n=1 Tax=Novipirellula artificiosorum TaxID=2528016 RepID=A0A5C6DZJ9_9BACT|nr:hypothetical protein [Novipirellula artificiosorum]TWU41875.1 hypothetical protein Poly41_01680 [Novipirellula artificiosorum]
MPETQIDNSILNCQLISVPYSTVLQAIKATRSDPFNMTIRCQFEWAAIAQCVNQGIDACSVKERDVYENGHCSISPMSLCVLLRRLGDSDFRGTNEHSAEDLWDAAISLQSSIFIVLGIDDCGQYVGREAMGLE